MKFNEDSRVKIPTILHLCRLGYTYLSLNKAKWDETTNIFPDIFKDSIRRINSDQQQLTVPQVLNIKILYPNEGVLKKFDSITSPMIEKIEVNKEENQKLIELRNWLLPMLMNGQIKIKDAEQELAMAAEPGLQYSNKKA